MTSWKTATQYRNYKEKKGIKMQEEETCKVCEAGAYEKTMTEESNGDTICTDCYEEKHYNSLEYNGEEW